jgi:hypothetical protein
MLERPRYAGAFNPMGKSAAELSQAEVQEIGAALEKRGLGEVFQTQAV